MKAIVTAPRDGRDGLLLKRPLGETLIARAVRILAESPMVTAVYGMTSHPEYAEHFEALNVRRCDPLERQGADLTVCIDAHYPMLAPETIEKAVEFARTLRCPIQSLGPVAEHPALSFEVLERLHMRLDVKTPEYSIDINLSGAPDKDVVYWLNVIAFRNEKIVASGWTEFSIPAYQQAFGGPQASSGPGGNGFAAEIMVDVVVEKRGCDARITAFWNFPEGADVFHVALFRTSETLLGRAKQYTIPGLMHSDPLSGCLVNPATGEKLINRQALPPLMERTNAVIAGRARDVADTLAGKRPKSLRGMYLSEEESTCIRHELDILRLRPRLLSQMKSKEVIRPGQTIREEP
jgi:hypothetical protein